MSIALLAPLLQAAPEVVTNDWGPVILQTAATLLVLTPILAGLGAGILTLVNNAIKRQEKAITEAAERQEKTFNDTIAHNVELVKSLGAATAEITRLGVIVQSVEGLKSEVARLQGDYTSLRAASDLERQDFKDRSTDYQKRIDADAEIIKTLQQSVESLTNEVTDLKGQVKSLIEQRDKLQDDKTARVEMSARGADHKTVDRMMSDAKAEMRQSDDTVEIHGAGGPPPEGDKAA